MESGSISRILYSAGRVAAISLGATLPLPSCGQPGSFRTGHPCPLACAKGRFPIRPCSERGLAGRRVSATPVGSYSTISPLPGPAGCSYALLRRATCPGLAALGRSRRYVSVPLSVGLPRLAFRQRSALRSSDFPHRLAPVRLPDPLSTGIIPLPESKVYCLRRGGLTTPSRWVLGGQEGNVTLG